MLKSALAYFCYTFFDHLRIPITSGNSEDHIMVMLIDDDKDDCDIFCDAANQITDCKCHCIHDPADALHVLDKAKKLPSCIFVDINMPGMDGFAVLKYLKNDARFSAIPIVMYSTTPNPAEAVKSIDLGADLFLRKTSDYNKLVGMLKKVKSDLIDGRVIRGS